jgi:hypothetical protein
MPDATGQNGRCLFRYSKGRPLDPETACWQGAISMGYLTTKLKQGLGDVDAERELCVAIDMWGAMSTSHRQTLSIASMRFGRCVPA